MFRIVGLIAVVLSGLPPIPIFLVPLDCFKNSLFDIELRFPAQASQLIRRDGVALVVAWPETVTMFNQGFRSTRGMQDHAGYFGIGLLGLLVRSDVVDLTRSALLHNGLEGLAVVMHSEPITNLGSAVIKRKWQSVECVRDE